MTSKELDRAARQVMDTGILNPYIKAYVYGAMKHAGIDDDTQERIINGLATMLDLYTAAEILAQVNKNHVSETN